MVSKFFYFILATVFTSQALAEKSAINPIVKTDNATYEKYCSDKNPFFIKRYSLPGQPSYWVKPMEKDGILYFTATINEKPTIIRASDSNTQELTGTQDLLPTFDSEILTVLDGKSGEYTIHFYDPSGLKDKKIVPYNFEIPIKGAYQSIAPLKSKVNSKVYRMLIDRFVYQKNSQTNEMEATSTAPSYLDFEKTKDNKLKPMGEFKNPCANRRLQTPFLSKDGKLFAALNLKTQTTQIFDISSGKCKMKYDVGFITGKADFSPDGKKLTFHLASFESRDKFGWSQVLGTRDTSNIFVYDLDKKKLQQITRNNNSNSYYPAFLQDGTIMHIDSVPAEAGQAGNFSIGISKNPFGSDTNTEGSLCAACAVKNNSGSLVIGQLLQGMCSDRNHHSLDADALIIKAGELSEEDCLYIVKKYWTENLQIELNIRQKVTYNSKVRPTDIENLKIDDLLIACRRK